MHNTSARACGDEVPLSVTIEDWSLEEAGRIVRVAQCVPEALRGEYIAQKMVEAISEFLAQGSQVQVPDVP